MKEAIASGLKEAIAAAGVQDAAARGLALRHCCRRAVATDVRRCGRVSAQGCRSALAEVTQQSHMSARDSKLLAAFVQRRCVLN